MIRAVVSSILLVLALAGPVRAETAAPAAEPTREQLQLQIDIMRDYIAKLENGTPAQSNPAPSLIDPAVMKAYNEAQLKQYESLVRQADLINQSFYEQRIILRTSLFLVALVVIAGVSFSAVQLWQGLSIVGTPLSNDVEISASKIKLTSSVIGVVVLAISLAFFYVFVSGSLKVERAASASTPAATSR